MNDLELLLAMVKTDAALAEALQVITAHIKTLAAEVAEQKAQIESLAFIQRAGKHVV